MKSIAFCAGAIVLVIGVVVEEVLAAIFNRE